jgi:hypothetical protein
VDMNGELFRNLVWFIRSRILRFFLIELDTDPQPSTVLSVDFTPL